MKAALVIPAYNEAAHISIVLEKAKKYIDIIIVVDDGSKDQTWKILKCASGNVIPLRHRVNLGKGAALKTGCEAARRLGAEIIVTIDADGQHPPEYIPAILDYMKSKNLDVVFSVRDGGDKMPIVRMLGNRVLNLMAHNLFNLRLRDIWCGFRAFKTSCLPKISWNKCDYSGEIQMALKVGQSKLAYGEYIIPTIYSDTAKGVSIVHGLKLLFQMLIWRITL